MTTPPYERPGTWLTTSSHLSPLSLEQINFIGDYVWSSGGKATENHDGF
jgi:hypothetical protein